MLYTYPFFLLYVGTSRSERVTAASMDAGEGLGLRWVDLWSSVIMMGGLVAHATRLSWESRSEKQMLGLEDGA